jgi:hypothetical protein
MTALPESLARGPDLSPPDQGCMYVIAKSQFTHPVTNFPITNNSRPTIHTSGLIRLVAILNYLLLEAQQDAYHEKSQQ